MSFWLDWINITYDHHSKPNEPKILSKGDALYNIRAFAFAVMQNVAFVISISVEGYCCAGHRSVCLYEADSQWCARATRLDGSITSIVWFPWPASHRSHRASSVITLSLPRYRSLSVKASRRLASSRKILEIVSWSRLQW